MNKQLTTIDQRLDKFFELSRVKFLISVYLLSQLLIFLYSVCVPGLYDRLGFVRGRDLLQFYISGRIVADGEQKRLYDQDFFYKKQREITPFDESHEEKCPRYFSLYPPTMALLVSPFVGCSYETFVVFGWLWTALGFLLAARWIIVNLNAPEEWQFAACLGVLGFHPAIVMLWNCQFSWLWLLGFLACFRLRRFGRPFAAGLCLSVLTLKPQFAAIAGVWLLMRRAWGSLAGLVFGFTLQAAVVSIFIGSEIWRDYFASTNIYSKMTDIFHFSPDYQQAILGTLKETLGQDQIGIARAIYLVIVAIVMAFSFRIFYSGSCDHRVEESAVIFLVLLSLPHLLIYDLTLLLIPISHMLTLNRSHPSLVPRWPAILLYLLTMSAPIYKTVPGFSPIPIIMFFNLWFLSKLPANQPTIATVATSPSQVPTAKTA